MTRMLLLAAVATVALHGCAATQGQPLPRLTFENYAPMTLNVQNSRVEEAYAEPNDPKNVAGQFVVPPSDAIKQYAAHRFPATGTGDGQFTIVIEDARVHLRSIDQKNQILSWSGVGKEDEYRLMLRLRVTPLPNGARGSAATIMKMDRTLVMPASVSVSEREERQLKFLEKLIADVDAGITKALGDTPGIRQ